LKPEIIQRYYEQNPSAQWLALASISLSSFVISLTVSALNVAVPTIAQDLEAHAILVSWIPTAFLLGNALLLLPAGRMADIHGRKKIFLVGILIFTVACVMGYFAPTIELLLFTRLLQGLAGALCFATGLALVMSIFTSENRGMAIGVASATLYLGLSCGPVIGGWITEHYGWRSVFLFPLVAGTVSVLLIVWKLKGEWKSDQAQAVDWYGGAVFALWVSALFIGISYIPDPKAFIFIFSGLVLMVYFYHQQLNSEYPLIRFKAILENHMFSRSLMGNLCIYASNYPFIFLFSLYLQFILGMSPANAGKLMVLQPIMMAIVAPIAGRLSDKFEPRIIATLGCLVMALAFGILQFIETETSVYFIGTALVTLGIGFGLFTTPNNSAALSSVDKARLGIASALLNLSRVSGNMIGTAMVLMLVSLLIGQVKIEPTQYPALLVVVHLALGASCLLSLTASYFSYSRGNIRKN